MYSKICTNIHSYKHPLMLVVHDLFHNFSNVPKNQRSRIKNTISEWKRESFETKCESR